VSGERYLRTRRRKTGAGWGKKTMGKEEVPMSYLGETRSTKVPNVTPPSLLQPEGLGAILDASLSSCTPGP